MGTAIAQAVLVWSDRILGAVVAVIMLLLVGVNAANIVGRYVFARGFPAADEIMTFALAWGVFLGAGLISLRGGHLVMDLLVGVLPRRIRLILTRVSSIWATVLLTFIIMQSFDYVETVAMVDMRSMGGGIPMTVPHLAVPFGLALMMVGGLLRLINAPDDTQAV